VSGGERLNHDQLADETCAQIADRPAHGMKISNLFRVAGSCMHRCCPPRRGCNAPAGGQPCALLLCRMFADVEPDAALALSRWAALEDASARPANGQQRFRRRAYERVRDRALAAIAMRGGFALARSRASRNGKRAARRSHRRRTARLAATAG
jgi:hypothetical protein